MSKPLIALPISQHFNAVFPKLADIIGAILVHNTEFLPANLVNYSYRKIYHANGFINIQFAEQITDELIEFLSSRGVSHMSFDLGPSCGDVYFHPEQEDIYWPRNSSVTLEPKQIVKIAKDRMEFLRKGFQGTIALENLDYHPGGAYEYVCEPDFIGQVLAEIGAYFAIDIAHILVTSCNLGLEPLEYISRLPLRRVREVHLSHPQAGSDKHDCPTADEYELLEHILCKSSPEFIAIEYYSDPGKIIEENIKLHRLLNN